MNYVILLSGGIGSRVGLEIAKQHIRIRDKQIVEYTLEAFSNSKNTDEIIVVSNPDYIEDIMKLKSEFPLLKTVVMGGKTRIDSAKNGIFALKDVASDDDKIIISDAARPCITKREIDELFSSLDTHMASTTCIASNETILKTENDRIVQIIPRDGIVRQTSPEGYRFSALRWLYLNNSEDIISSYRNIGIDQLSASGVDIGIVKSTPLNFKITTRTDLEIFDGVLKSGFETIINS